VNTFISIATICAVMIFLI